MAMIGRGRLDVFLLGATGKPGADRRVHSSDAPEDAPRDSFFDPLIGALKSRDFGGRRANWNSGSFVVIAAPAPESPLLADVFRDDLRFLFPGEKRIRDCVDLRRVRPGRVQSGVNRFFGKS